MKRTCRFLCLSLVLAGMGLAVSMTVIRSRASAEGKPPNPPQPANHAVGQPNVPKTIPPYASKYVIEVPTEQLLAKRSVSAAAAPGPEFVNPKVEPGKVRWHKDFTTACREAQKSGKPVLLFQMMGKLDDRFC